MRIILDGNLPRDLGRLLLDHSVQTIHEPDVQPGEVVIIGA